HLRDSTFTDRHNIIVVDNAIAIRVVVFQITGDNSSKSLLSAIDDIFFILKESDSLETKFLTDALSRSEEIWIGLCFLIHFKDFISRKRSVDIYEVIDFTNMVGMFDFNFETFILGFSKIG